MIWFAILIPIIITGIISYKHPEKWSWWERLIPIGAVLISIAVCKSATESVQIQDTEYHGSWIVNATYEEHWDEWIEETCTRSVSCGKDCTTTESYDCSYRKDHPALYYIEESATGKTLDIDPGYFNWLCEHFGNKNFIEMNRHYYRIDGDAYQTIWSGQREKLVPVSTIHTYTNRVQASSSVYRFPDITPEQAKKKGLYEYPAIDGQYQTENVLGPVGKQKNEAERYIGFLNATMGRPNQIRLYILVWQNRDRQVAFDQQAYWQGGNKNEFVVCIGTDKQGNVKWCQPFSWTEKENFKVNIRNDVMTQRDKPLDLMKVIRALEMRVPKEWERKQFADFNYLTVEPPMWMIILTYLLAIGITVGTCYWCHVNDIDSSDSSSRTYRRYSRY
jgi:hypothetical protein